MTKKWSSPASGDGKTKRKASKDVRSAGRREEKEMAAIADEYDLDPLADFLEHLKS